MSNTDESAADRALWHAAQSVLSGAPDAEALRRLHRQKVVRLWVIVVALALPLLVVPAVLLTAGHHPAHRHSEPHIPTWRSVLSYSLTLVGACLEILSLVRLARAKTFGSPWKAPQQVLTRRQRKHLLRQVEARTPVDPRTLPLARDLALRLTRTVLLMPLIAGLMCVVISQVVLHVSAWQVAYLAAMVVLMGVAVTRTRRQLRLARQFLAAYPVVTDPRLPPAVGA